MFGLLAHRQQGHQPPQPTTAPTAFHRVGVEGATGSTKLDRIDRARIGAGAIVAILAVVLGNYGIDQQDAITPQFGGEGFPEGEVAVGLAPGGMFLRELKVGDGVGKVVLTAGVAG